MINHLLSSEDHYKCTYFFFFLQIEEQAAKDMEVTFENLNIS